MNEGCAALAETGVNAEQHLALVANSQSHYKDV